MTTSLADRVVKYCDLAPCYDAFIDTRTPGSDQKENFTIIGPGVSENPNQYVHIAEPHGFNIGGARQPPGCTNSQHSHETAEVFYVHSGTWRFDLGEHGDDAQTVLSPGDLITIPTHVFRGFTNVGDDTGFLWAILGGDDPGRVLWAPKVFDLASEYGLVLLDDGMLIDTNKGEIVPDGKTPMPRTTRAQVEALHTFSAEQLEACVCRSGTIGPKGELNALSGVAETLLIGRGRMNWPHGFQVSEVNMQPGAVVPPHQLSCPDVWFVQSGRVIVSIEGRKTILSEGDTCTIPPRLNRKLENSSDQSVTLVTVKGGDNNPDTVWS